MPVLSMGQVLGGDLEAQGCLSPVRASEPLFWGMLLKKESS